MSKYTSLQQTARFPAYFERFQTEVHALRLNETKITNENAFNQGHLGFKGNFEWDNDQKPVLGIFADLWPMLYNSQTPKDVYLRFSHFIWFLQFLSHYLFRLEARNKLIQFYTKFWVKYHHFSADFKPKRMF